MPIITMTYGSGNLSPVPLMNLNKEYQKTADGTAIGSFFRSTLNGTLYAPTGGVAMIVALQDEIRSIFDEDGKKFEIQCDGNPLLLCYPRINAINFDQSSNNWVITCPYTVELEFDDEPQPTSGFESLGENSGIMPPFISDFQEGWNLEFVEERSYFDLASGDYQNVQLRLTHSISAVGKRRFTGGGLEMAAWEQARNKVISHMGYDSSFAGGSGVFNISVASFTGFNHMRTNSVDEAGGSYSVTESWLLVDQNGYGNAVEDFTVDVRTGIDSALTTVGIQGSIQGLETRTYGSSTGQFSVVESKIAAASGYWNNIKDSLRIYPRAQLFAGATTRPINTLPLSKSVGYNPSAGLITYNYEYNDRPSNCIANSLIETISITDTNPVDVFAEIPIPGRSAGPVLQDMNTVTSRKRDISINLVMAPSTGCGVASLFATNPTTDVDNLIQLFYAELTGSYGQVFTHVDTPTWEPKEGRYTRQVGWTIGNCS